MTFLPVCLLKYPVIDPVALKLGPIAIRWYGLAYMAGILLGWFYLTRLIKNKKIWGHEKSPLARYQLDDFIIWVTLGIILGGRIGYFALYHPEYLARNPLDFFKVWQGGMAFHGGLIGVGLATYLFARRHKITLFSLIDLVAAAAPIGLFFGRIANFINTEVVGRVADVPWAMVFPGYGDTPRHPSQLYEALLEGLLLFIILYFFIHKREALKKPGLIGGIFLMGYGLTRIFCEFFRQPYMDEYATLTPWLTSGVIYSLPMVAIGLWLIVRAKAGAAGAKETS